MTAPLIFIEEMKVETMIGVSDWERALPQTLIIDLEMALPQMHQQSCRLVFALNIENFFGGDYHSEHDKAGCFLLE